MMKLGANTSEVRVVRTVFVFNKHCEDGTVNDRRAHKII